MKSRRWAAAEPSRPRAAMHVCCVLAAGRAAGFRFSQRGCSHPGSAPAGKALVPRLNRLYKITDTGFGVVFFFFCKVL